MSTSWSATEHDYDPEFEEVPDKGASYDLPTERLAVVSLVAGIAGFFLPIVGPVTAVVSGHVARGEIRKSNGRLGGDAMARTGLILGYVWLGLTALGMLVMLGFTMLLVSSGPERAAVHGQAFRVPAERSDRPNLMIQRLDGGRLMIHHDETADDHGGLREGTIRLHHEGPARSGHGFPALPGVPRLP
ncbi:DUF4190 domain-containing protein [Tautonia sp. JC769]|uniref:DUF4190 domain-containing protein n=1 Tax=Tautonia sp. JC769 TaxID=3232135 RepID=UPI003459A4E7